jgi:hypothetical protein
MFVESSQVAESNKDKPNRNAESGQADNFIMICQQLTVS